MTRPASPSRPAQPPTRRLRLLARLAPGAAVLFELLTVWLVVSTLDTLASVLGSPGDLAAPTGYLAVVLLVLDAGAAVITGLVTYRLAVQVPRTLRGWDAALAERTRVLRGD